MSIAGNGRRVSLDFLENYTFSQIYSQPELDYISLEPMVAPADALTNGKDLPAVEPGGRFAATFRVRVELLDNSVH
jgi:aldose 1-epimerase